MTQQSPAEKATTKIAKLAGWQKNHVIYEVTSTFIQQAIDEQVNSIQSQNCQISFLCDKYYKQLTAQQQVIEQLVTAGNEAEQFLWDLYGCIDTQGHERDDEAAGDMLLSDSLQKQHDLKLALVSAKALEEK